MTRRSNGEGSSYKRPDGLCRETLRYTDPDTGESRRVAFYGKTKTEARRKLKAAQQRLEAGLPVRDSKRTVAVWLAQWRATALAASDRADSTKATYATLSKLHLEPAPFGSITLGALRPSHIQAHVVALGKTLSESTVRQTYSVLRQALSDAVREGVIAKNVAESVQRPRVSRKEARFLSLDELARLLKAAEGSRYLILLEFIAKTGVRKGEALATLWTDLDLEAGTYRVPGTKSKASRRTLAIGPDLVAKLTLHRDLQTLESETAANLWTETGLVFTTEFGTAVGPREALRVVQRAAKKAKLKGVSVHTLRHSAATALIEQGVSLRAVSEILGHSDTSITAEIYTHASQEARKAAMEGLDGAIGL